MIKQFPDADIKKGKMAIDEQQGFKNRRSGRRIKRCRDRTGSRRPRVKPSSMFFLEQVGELLVIILREKT
jgi:hypothetical protein